MMLKRERRIYFGEWFWLHKVILSKYIRKLGASGFLVYSTLAFFADSRTQSCFPTQKILAKLTGLSRRTIIRKLNLLEELGLIRKEKRKGRCIYWLLEPDGTGVSQPCDRCDTSNVSGGHTNNNYLTKINNNNSAVKNFSRFRASREMKPKTKEELLALDIAKALDDEKHFDLYLFYARRYPESFLRGILGEVMEIPPDKLKKGRAALFNYLVQKHAKEKDPGH